jgi:hypothetical protein
MELSSRTHHPHKPGFGSYIIESVKKAMLFKYSGLFKTSVRTTQEMTVSAETHC